MEKEKMNLMNLKILFVGEVEKGQQGFAPLRKFFSDPDSNSLLFLEPFDNQLIQIDIVYYTDKMNAHSIDALILEEGWERSSAGLGGLERFLPVVGVGFLPFPEGKETQADNFPIDLTKFDYWQAMRPLIKIIQMIKHNPACGLSLYVPGCICSGFQCMCFDE